MATYYTLLTKIGQARIANAVALNQMVNLTYMAVGDGNGNPTTPNENQTALVREKYRATINQLTVDPENPNYLVAEMIVPTNVGGWSIYEVGVFDDQNQLIAVANFPATYKPELAEGSGRDLIVRIIIQVSNTSVVTLKIDPAITLASQAWVAANYVKKTTVAGGTTGQILAKKSNANEDFQWVEPTAAVDVNVFSREETQTVATGQTIINLAQLTTDGAAIYIEGIRLRDDQFTVNSPTRLTLATSYPAGTKVTIVQNEETSRNAFMLKSNNLSDLTSQSVARTNLGFDALGFGLTTQTTVNNVDWQQVDFLTNGLYVFNSENWTNAPEGLVFAANQVVFVEVISCVSSGTVIELILTSNAVDDANFYKYELRIANAKGSRTFSVRKIFTSANVIPTANLDAPGRLLGAPKVYTASGSYTPGANVKSIVVEIVGGGGGGGAASSSANYNAAGGGGGGGGYAKKYIPISSTAPIAFTVGLGGNGATYPAISGQAGGATTFGTGFTATGGNGGNTAASNAASTLVGMGGAGGTASGGNINSNGSGGQCGVAASPSIAGGSVGGGFGGASVISGQGSAGGGGPGAATTTGNQALNGNRGNDGIVIIWEYA